MPNALELIKFWGTQLSQHALFLSLGLEDSNLSKTAGVLHTDWERFRARIPEEADANQVADLTQEVEELAAELRDFKTYVHNRLMAGEWLGWLYPSFVGHVRSELDYFLLSLRNVDTPPSERVSQELCTWLQFMADHAAFAEHLLDPSEERLVKQAQVIKGQLQKLENRCVSVALSLVELSQRAGNLLDRYLTTSGIGTERVKSIIHPVLALHVVREGRMFLRTLAEIQGKPREDIEIPE